jgi:hypothetical protein
MCLRSVVALLILVPTCLVAGDLKKYGKALELKQEVQVADILASPDSFAGKKVRVKGVVTDVCEERGCWIRIGASKKEILFKVDDGVISFPMSAKGGSVTAEGLVSKRVLSVEQQKAQCDNEAKATKKPADYSKVTGPKTIVRIEGLGAEIQ